MAGPKFKAYRRKKDRVPEGVARLRRAAKEEEVKEKKPEMAGFASYLRSANVREERDRLTDVDRALLLTAILFNIAGLLLLYLVLAI